MICDKKKVGIRLERNGANEVRFEMSRSQSHTYNVVQLMHTVSPLKMSKKLEWEIWNRFDVIVERCVMCERALAFIETWLITRMLNNDSEKYEEKMERARKRKRKGERKGKIKRQTIFGNFLLSHQSRLTAITYYTLMENHNSSQATHYTSSAIGSKNRSLFTTLKAALWF